MTRTRRLTAITLGILALAGALMPAAAWAHAQLISTSPTRDAVVETQPKIVSFTFGEPVTGTAGAVRVYDSAGNRVDQGDAGHHGNSPRVYGVSLKPGLPHGTYTATYRIVSADSHIVTGGFAFSIGSRSGSGANVGQLLSGQKTGAVTSDAFILARSLQYAAIALGAGIAFFLLVIWLPAMVAVEDPRPGPAVDAALGRARRLVLIAAGVGLVSAVAALGLEGAEAAGVPLWSAYTATIMGDVLGTRFGTVWLAAAVIWLVTGVAVLVAGRAGKPRTRAALSAPAGALILLPALAGHSSVEHPVWLLFPMNVIHVSAMTAWLGGLVALVAVVPGATRVLAGPDRTRLLAATLGRFSPLALACVCALLVTGIVQSLVEIDAWSELLHTSYGRAVLIKIVLLAGLIALGAQNRQRTVPRMRRLAAAGETPGATGVVLRRALRAEVGVIAVVLLVTGALSGYAPAKTAYSGPVNVTTSIGPEQLQMTVEPAKAGVNEIHIYLLNPRSGAQFNGTKQFTISASLPAKSIGPLPIQSNKAGPGHYIVTQAILGTPGEWTLHLVDRVSDFDEYDKTVKVKIR